MAADRPQVLVEGVLEPRVATRGQEILEHFLANRKARTRRAYAIDIQEFAGFLDVTPAAAIGELLGRGPRTGGRLLLEYAVNLRQKGRAEATVSRRLSTLRTLVRMARKVGMVDWELGPLSTDVVSSALAESRRSDSEHYFFPREPSEIDRLDVQHYALREVVGRNFLAPVMEPSRILDVGCGTGQWAFDVCQQFLDALVVGFDLVSGKLDWPPRYRLVKGNLLQGLPFADDQFDFVHQRLLVSGVPVVSWPSVVTELVRVTKPGGWVELVEPPLGFARTGPATRRLFSLWGDLANKLGLEAGSEVFDALDGYLREAGLEEVRRREIEAPVGEWGGRAGSLMMTDFRATATRVCGILLAQSELTSEEADEVIRTAQHEAEDSRLSWSIAIAFGRKPRRDRHTT